VELRHLLPVLVVDELLEDGQRGAPEGHRRGVVDKERVERRKEVPFVPQQGPVGRVGGEGDERSDRHGGQRGRCGHQEGDERSETSVVSGEDASRTGWWGDGRERAQKSTSKAEPHGKTGRVG